MEKKVSMIEDPQKVKPQYLTSFFWWCSGAVVEVLEDYPTEKNKYVGMGAAIFCTWMLASVSGIFAFYTIFHSLPIALLVGIVYGLIIFNLDRFITSSMRKVGSEDEVFLLTERISNIFFHEWLPAIPRVLIAVLIGFVISKPLELELFNVEINEQLEKDNAILLEDYESLLRGNSALERNDLDRDLELLSIDLAEKQEFILNTKEMWRQEVGGNNIGGKGEGKIAQSYQAVIDSSEVERLYIISQMQIVESSIQDIKKVEEQAVIAFQEEQLSNIGFFRKLEALDNLIKNPENRSMWWANFFMICMIILIELAPILVKLIASRGPYDAALNYINKSQMIYKDRALKKIKYIKKTSRV